MHEFLARFERIDHRRRELGIGRDVADPRRETAATAIAGNRYHVADRNGGEQRFGNIELQLHGSVRQHREHGRGRSGNVACIADHVEDAPRSGGDDRPVRISPFGLLQRRLGLLDLALGRLDRLGPRRKRGDGEVGLGFADPRIGEVGRRPGLVELGLRGDAALVEVGGPLQRALRIVRLHLGRAQRRFEHRDLFRPLAFPQVRELRLRLCQGSLCLRDGDLGVAVFQPGKLGSLVEPVSTPDHDGDDLSRLDRRQKHVLALDIADGQGRRGGAGEQRRDHGNAADEAHRSDSGFVSPARSAASRCIDAAATATIFATSCAPKRDQPMRFRTMGLAIRK